MIKGTRTVISNPEDVTAHSEAGTSKNRTNKEIHYDVKYENIYNELVQLSEHFYIDHSQQRNC